MFTTTSGKKKTITATTAASSDRGNQRVREKTKEDEWERYKRPLLTTGAIALLSSLVSYNLRHTNAFKISYAVSCVTIGPAMVLYAMPSREQISNDSGRDGRDVGSMVIVNEGNLNAMRAIRASMEKK
jgi:hypothetical protein